MSAPPFAYFGGKVSLADRIVDLPPKTQHYVEPFAGSLSVLLAKPRSAMETVNDLDGHLMTFWRVLRDKPDELARVCALTPHSRGEHEESFDLDVDDDVERARRVWVRLTQGRGGMLRRTGWRHYVEPGNGTSGMPDYLAGYVSRLMPAAARLAGVTLESRPALDLIAKYGGHAGVLLYVDPPYLGSTRIWGNQYQHELRTEAEHRELIAALRECKAQVVLSGYDSALYGDLLGDWATVRIKASTGNARDGERDRVEVLWSNRPLATAPGLFDLEDAS